jgi:hypothetical protein
MALLDPILLMATILTLALLPFILLLAALWRMGTGLLRIASALTNEKGHPTVAESLAHIARNIAASAAEKP